MVPQVTVLIATITLAGPGWLSGQNSDCSPMNGVLYLAQGRGPHPTVVFLHGFPGDEKNLDLAQALRRAGFNALVFFYRGAWGSPGTYSYSHVLEDASSALTWLRQPAFADSMRVDSGEIILVGHSLGGFVALYTAATSDNVAAVAALAPVDLGSRGAALRDSVVFAKEVRRRESQLGAIRGTSGEALSREAMDRADAWGLQRYAGALAEKRVLLIAAAHDEAVPQSEVYEPLGAKLRAVGARELTTLTLETDHVFSNLRITVWFGCNSRQGVGIIARPPFRLIAEPVRAGTQSMFAAKVLGPVSFTAVAVWAQLEPTYSEALRLGLTIYRDLLLSGPCVVLGDLNSSVAWDNRHGRNDHRELEKRLREEFGLVSAYHVATGEQSGEESRPTHFWRWHEGAPFHLDYCYLPERWLPGLKSVTVGSYEEWADASDHRPLTVEVIPPAEFTRAAV